MIRIIFIFLLLSPFYSFANIKIVTSITPLSSLASMILGNKGTIKTIASTQGCPHSYALKPSDLGKMEKANLFIYIDQNFDLFASKLLEKFPIQNIEISRLPEIEINSDNLHLWLLPKNAIAILKSITQRLIELSPENRIYFETNLKTHIAKIEYLEQQRQKLAIISKNIITLSDSTEYILSGMDQIKNYQNAEYSSLKINKKLRELGHDRAKCFIISSDQDIEKYHRLLGQNVLDISTENWPESEPLDDLYYNEYHKILNSIIDQCG